MSDSHTGVGRRRFLIGTAAAAGGAAILPTVARRAAAQASRPSPTGTASPAPTAR